MDAVLSFLWYCLPTNLIDWWQAVALVECLGLLRFALAYRAGRLRVR